MMKKKIAISLLAFSLLTGTVAPAYADSNEVTSSGGVGYSDITLKVKDNSESGGDGGTDFPDDPEVFSASVPISLPIVMDLKGNIAVPTNAEIINHVANRGIKVTSIDVALEPDWSASDYTVAFDTYADNTKILGLSLRGDTLKPDGSFPVTDGNWDIAKKDSLPINMRVKIPKQTVESEGKIATVGFTLDWSDADAGSNPDNGGETPPDTKTHTVTFESDSNGSIEGNTTAIVGSGDTVSFPATKPASIRYEFDKWVDSESNAVITPDTPITADKTVKAVFKAKAASPKNWFVAVNGTITGLSDEYLNLVDAPTELIIPNNIGGSTIKTIGANAFANKDLITSIVIPDTVQYIGKNAFEGCTSITQLNLDYAAKFYVTGTGVCGLPAEKIAWGANEEWDVTPVRSTDLASMGLIYDATKSGISGIPSTISGEITLPTSVDGHKVSLILDNGFAKCNKVTSVHIPDSIDTIGTSAFYMCSALKNVNIPNGITDLRTNTFAGCYSLANISIPTSVTTIGEGVFASTILTDITIPDGVEIVSNGLFQNCPKLLSVRLPEGIKSIGDHSFSGCTSLTDINLPESISSIGVSAFYGCTNLTDVVLPKSLETIKKSAFSNSGLTDITIPENVTFVGEEAFFRCENLTSVIINKPKSHISLYDKAFSNCKNLISVDLPEGTLLGRRNFEQCSSLKTVNIPIGTSGLGECVFWGCTNLTSITIPESIAYIGVGAFSECVNLTVTIPDNIENINISSFYKVKHIYYNGNSPQRPFGAIAMN